MTESTLIEDLIKKAKASKQVTKFVEKEAKEQLIKDINNVDGRCCTPLALEMLLLKGDDQSLMTRFENYVNAGYTAIIMTQLQKCLKN